MLSDSKLFQKAVRYSIKLLSIRRRTIYEIITKLQNKKFEKNLIQEVLDFLIDQNYLNDKDFVREFIDIHRRTKLYGLRRLRFELKKRGVNKSNIEFGLKSITFDDEMDCARKAAQTKILSLQKCGKLKEESLTISDKKLIYEFLLRRGFTYDIAHSVVNDLSI